VLVNANNKDGNMEYAERLRNIIEKLEFPNIDSTLKITASLGVSSYRHPESIDFLVARADKALYHAKTKGKNRVEYL
jgi:diguanylate cyclase (GGDEF)-like protein